jgi:hypothetical protein
MFRSGFQKLFGYNTIVESWRLVLQRVAVLLDLPSKIFKAQASTLSFKIIALDVALVIIQKVQRRRTGSGGLIPIKHRWFSGTPPQNTHM